MSIKSYTEELEQWWKSGIKLNVAQAQFPKQNFFHENTAVFQWDIKVHFALGSKQLVSMQLTLQRWTFLWNIFKKCYQQQTYRIIKLQWKFETEQLTQWGDYPFYI